MTFIGSAFAPFAQRAGHGLLAFVLALPRPKKEQPDDEGPLRLWHWIEDNGTIVFPLIGLVILALVIVAVRRSAVNQEAELHHRREQMDTIVRLMRARLSLNADQTAGELRVDRHYAAALLSELVKEGALVEGRLPGGVIVYRLKGI